MLKSSAMRDSVAAVAAEESPVETPISTPEVPPRPRGCYVSLLVRLTLAVELDCWLATASCRVVGCYT